MDWLILLIIAYFFISLTALSDKFIVTKALSHPIVYAFFVSTLGLAVILLAPFGFKVPTGNLWLLTFVAGAGYTVAICWLYSALQTGEASRVFTISGSLGAVCTFILSYYFLGERLSSTEVVAFILLIIGAICIGYEFNGTRAKYRSVVYAVCTAVAFGVSYTATKYVYTTMDFIPGFIWIRVFAFVAIVLLLLYPPYFGLVKNSFKVPGGIQKRSNQILLLGGQGASAIGFLILNYVISLTSATLVLAAQGLQYAFLLLLTLFISFKFPRFLREQYTRQVLIQKGVAILMIAAGLFALAR